MLKQVIALLIILLTTTTSFSSNISKDTTVLITSKQLKEANLIFVEHAKLLKENPLLIKQIDNYQRDNALLIEANSIKNLQIKNYQELSESYKFKLEELNSKLKKKDKNTLIWKIGGVTVSTSLLLLLLLK